jgi:PleD family two-component response regulator
MWEKLSEQLVMPLGESDGKWISTLPIIMPTSRQGEQDIVEGLKSGLDDYIVSKRLGAGIPIPFRVLGG